MSPQNEENSQLYTEVISNSKLDAKDYGYQPLKGAPDPPPLEKPPFTLKQLRDAIPPHCFERSTVTALLYTVHNIFVCAVLFYCATWIQVLALPLILNLALWSAYWFLMGAYMFGLWILGHECGHESYSQFSIVNDVMGLLLHSFLLVPYHNWRISHSQHHMHTGSFENDQVFVPATRSRMAKIWLEVLEESPLFNFIRMVILFIFGFLPLYLVFNWTGPLKYKGQNANHFSPSSIIFLPKHRTDIIVSDIVFFLWMGCLAWFSYQFGFKTVMCYYGVPLVVVNVTLAIVTYLQHTDSFVPHFGGEEWTWLRGALCTVDRSWGTWLDGVHHHISDTHVVHHLFSKLPFYHAQEATEAIIPVLGKFRLMDETPIFTALWRAIRRCKFVEDDQNIVFYQGSMSLKDL